MLKYTEDKEKQYLERRLQYSGHMPHATDVEMTQKKTEDSDVDKVRHKHAVYVVVAVLVTVAVLVLCVLSATLWVFNVFTVRPTTSVILPTTSNILPSCSDQCRISLVESIPENLTYSAGSPSHASTFDTWMTLIRSSKNTIHIASFYWSLRGSDVWEDPSDWQGEQIFHELLVAGTQRNITIRIAQNLPSPMLPNKDTSKLASTGAAEVRSLDFPRWFGNGVLHTKMLLVDGKHFYVGSANFDWRALTQVKELGASLYNCSCLAEDMQKIFDVYWFMGKPNQSLPHQWPREYATSFNQLTPMKVELNNTRSTVYLTSSPPEFCPKGRTSDIDAIVDVIRKARKFIHVAVMDYSPTTLYTHPKRFWPVIDDALRRASLEQGVEVRIMASLWNHTKPDMMKFLQSLAALSGAMKATVRVKLFEVPSYTEAQKQIPFARVNHNKYMVTDNAAYIGTSNWSGDYFISTGGIGLVINQTSSKNIDSTVQQQLADIFARDWNSSFAHPLSTFLNVDIKHGLK